MARVRVTAGKTESKPEVLAGEAPRTGAGPWQFRKCECPGDKPDIAVLASTGGRCPKCLRGVHVALPEPSDADESVVTEEASLGASVGDANPSAAKTTPPPVDFSKARFDPETRTMAWPPGEEPSPKPPATVTYLGQGVGQSRSGSGAAPNGDEGEVVRIVLNEEKYALKGTYSSYVVPIVAGETKVRPGETRPDALRRLSAELHEHRSRERDLAKAEFEAHFPKAFSGIQGQGG